MNVMRGMVKTGHRGRAAFLAAAAAGLLLSPTAEAKLGNVPLPRLRPTIDGNAEPAAQPLKKLIPTPARGPVSDQQALANISAYFNSFQTMEGQFIQFGPHGEQSEGTFTISRPGKVRFHYNPPALLDVIADGYNVAIRDARAQTQTTYPLSKTPLRYLLANNVDLTSTTLVSQVRRERDLIAVIIVDNSKFGQYKLTLIFDPQTYELKQWIVNDPQGLNTSTAIYNTTVGKRPDPNLFKIDYFAFRR